MPRGEETQETQEGREINQEAQEANLEAERTQEVVEQPQVVVERERPVQESEQIEKEVVEAVEAAVSSAARSEDEVSATPITLPDPPSDEISATPITLPKEDGGPKTDDRESQVTAGEEVSATPINTPGGADQVDLSPDDVKMDQVKLPIKLQIYPLRGIL